MVRSSKAAWREHSRFARRQWVLDPKSTYRQHRFSICSFDGGFAFFLKAFGNFKQFSHYLSIGLGKLLSAGGDEAFFKTSSDLPDSTNAQAVVVTFNPDQAVFQNLKLLLSEFKEVIIVDNSPDTQMEAIRSALSPEFSALKILKNGNENGLGGALNLGLRTLYQVHSSGWVFLFDQDTCLKPEFLIKVGQSLRSEKQDDLGNTLYGVDYDDEKTQTKKEVAEITEVRTLITSGSFMRLENLPRVGLYIEEVFIDSLDHDYCIRAKRFGMKIKKINLKLMKHSLGAIKLRQFFLKKDAITTNHAPFRWYFFVRNFWFIGFENFPGSLPWVLEHGFALSKNYLKVWLYEDLKLKKTTAAIRGFFAFFRLLF